jgi:hypothetical protein
MMPGNTGPIGDVGAISGNDKTNVEMDAPHGLENEALVRIRQGPWRLEGYVSPDRESDKRFRIYTDQEMRRPASLANFAAGAKVELLNADHWAVVAGINFYPGIRNLQGPMLDAATFRNWAQDAGYVPDRQVLRVPCSLAHPELDDAQPSMEGISRPFETLFKAAEKRKFHRLGRRLYLFFSGHGIVAAKTGQPDFNEAMGLAANAEPMLLAKHVALRSWAEWFRVLGIFDEVFLFADCCRDLEDLVTPMPITAPGDWRAERGAGRQFYVFSTKFASKAWEQTLGNPPQVRGVLSYVVTEALKNPKLYNARGELTASDLEAHIYNEVPKLSDKQEPVIEYARKPNAELIVAKWVDRQQQTVQIRFLPPLPGATADLFAGGTMKAPLQSHVINGQTWVQQLDANLLYKVAIRNTSRKCLFETSATDEVQDVTV